MKMCNGKYFNKNKVIWAWALLLVLFVIGFVYKITSDEDDIRKINLSRPEQVRLSYGESPNEIVVTWITRNIMNSTVVYGINELNLHQKGEHQQLEVHNHRVHRVTLSNLTPNTTYIYRCGSDKAWSKRYHFHVPPSDSKGWVLSVAIYGDLGFHGRNAARVYPLLRDDTRKKMYDAILHIGDIAYNMHEIWIVDEFGRAVETVAAYVPYMTCAGNHENNFNFTPYRQRFNMPGDTEGLYYSFNLGPVHFIAVHTEVYYYLNEHYQNEHIIYQYQWLEKDLKEANKPENRAKRPWILVYGHRPMYCSVISDEDCAPQFASMLRKGIPVMNGYGLEDLLFRYGVDITFWGHQHSYERSWPLYNNKTFNASLEEPYRNAKAPVHITSGAAGCQSLIDVFPKLKPEWAAIQSSEWSFTRMKAYNATHLYFEQISYKNVTTDSFWIIKDNVSISNGK